MRAGICGRGYLLLVALFTACAGPGRNPGGLEPPVEAQLEQLLLENRTPPAANHVARGQYWHRSLVRFYEARRFRPAWVGPHGALRQADELLQALQVGADHGLPGRLYRHSELKAAVAASRRGAPQAALARLDLLLTETFIVFADHLRRGLVDPRQLNPHWHVPDLPGDLAGLLTTLLALHDVGSGLERLTPRRTAYTDLVQFLAATQGTDRARLEANLERWRWLPRDFGQDYVLVRLAAFELEWVHAGVAQQSRRVIIGEPFRRTPSFASQITDIVVHPSWHVPETIAQQELVPLARRDAGVLQRRGFMVVQGDEAREPEQIDWLNEAQTSRLRFIQAPGGGNPLGAVKFHLPNAFAIYLHDTPAPSLFATADRDLSHGCVRVEGAVDLARQIIGDGSAADRFEALLASPRTGTVHLPTPLPVYFIYWTLDVVDGQLRVLQDIYAEDGVLIAALARATAAPHTRTWGALRR